MKSKLLRRIIFFTVAIWMMTDLISCKKDFLKNNAASLTLQFSDIFRTRKSDQHSESAFFVQDYNRLRDPQMLRLNFTYRFGKMDVSLFKRKNMNSGGDATQGMQQ